ncbi:hypothetical protein BN8_00517 [Fibrisoma limi BUZ 3]|uniref:DUF3800 domain-containing protein n=1 Tax=Fibrisoma limi BUZ 3 TaxID=1185876 RepID=I2GCG3_9BACT|nr:DUF3800 domain-containing protein [Fibrisoma limi]CCH51587.1 hypothetical protein BN8_00517 [Fibrisoma limi BUZ 3]
MHIAYLDEWGNKGLDFTKKDVSTHFIVCALTLPREKLPEAEEHIEAVRKRFFQTGPIKSSGVGKSDTRRRQILTELMKAPFQLFALVVDKRRLWSEGFTYAGSFYKYLHGLADKELYRLFQDLELVADQHGSDTFMEGFIRYVQARQIPPTIFNQSSFTFVNDKTNVLIQAADFVAGTLARCYDEMVMSDQRQAFTEIIRPKLLMLKYWPEVFPELTVTPNVDDTRYNAELAQLSINLANDHLNKRTGRAPQQIDQITCLHYLIFYFRYVDPMRYVSSRELMRHISERRGKVVTLHYFQTRVIAPLRDAGVLIASSSKGYKLPACEQDLYDYINHSNTIIQPLLSRIRKCRDQIRLATHGAVDVLDKEEYGSLKKILEDQ